MNGINENVSERLKILESESGAIFNPPRVLIKLEAMEKIFQFVRLAPEEICGFGLVERIGNDFLITDAFILNQEVSPGGAETVPLALNRFVGAYEGDLELSFQWHSHVTMESSFSPKDTDSIRRESRGFGDYLISLVLNKSGQYVCRIDLFKPVYLAIAVPLLIVLPEREDLADFCRREIEEKVRGSGFIHGLKRTLGVEDKKFVEPSQRDRLMVLPLDDFASGGEEE